MRIPDLEKHFARLERDMRRMRTTLLFLLIVAAGLLLAQILPRSRADAVKVIATSALLFAAAEIAGYVWRQTHAVPEVVRAKKFEVVDDDGHIFVEIGETIDGRGAVVTHDGDSNAVLTPARNSHDDGETSESASDEGGPAHGAGAPEQPQPRVQVRLEYRGEGVYRAVIRERGDDDEEPPHRS